MTPDQAPKQPIIDGVPGMEPLPPTPGPTPADPTRFGGYTSGKRMTETPGAVFQAGSGAIYRPQAPIATGTELAPTEAAPVVDAGAEIAPAAANVGEAAVVAEAGPEPVAVQEAAPVDYSGLVGSSAEDVPQQVKAPIQPPLTSADIARITNMRGGMPPTAEDIEGINKARAAGKHLS